MWKEVEGLKFRVMYRNVYEVTEQHHDEQHNNWFPRQDLNHRLPKYESGGPTARLWRAARSVQLYCAGQFHFNIISPPFWTWFRKLSLCLRFLNNNSNLTRHKCSFLCFGNLKSDNLRALRSNCDRSCVAMIWFKVFLSFVATSLFVSSFSRSPSRILFTKDGQ